jgi:hypothetical protein
VTLTELMRTTPWGLHDAYLVKIGVDFAARTVEVDVRLKMAGDQTSDQLARLHFAGMAYFATLPPDATPDQSDPLPWIDQLHDDSPQFEALRAKHPPVPANCFLAAVYARDSWQYFVICARDVTLSWLEAAPVPVSWRSGRRKQSPLR